MFAQGCVCVRFCVHRRVSRTERVWERRKILVGQTHCLCLTWSPKTIQFVVHLSPDTVLTHAKHKKTCLFCFTFHRSYSIYLTLGNKCILVKRQFIVAVCPLTNLCPPYRCTCTFSWSVQNLMAALSFVFVVFDWRVWRSEHTTRQHV